MGALCTQWPVQQAVLLLVLLATADAAATVEHSLDAGRTFSKAGRIHLENAEEVRASFERDAFTGAQLQQLKGLVEADGLYLWRVSLPNQAPVLTSIKAACLAADLISHQLSLHLDAAGRIMSAQVSVPPAATPDGSCSTSLGLQSLQRLSPADLSDLPDLEVSVTTPARGPSVPQRPADAAAPDLQAAAGAAQQQQAAAQQKRQQQQQQRQAGNQAGSRAKAGDSAAEGGKEAKDAPPVDERTWLQKNWLILMAGGTMILNIVLRNVVDPQAQAAAGQQGRPAQRRPAQ